MKYFNVSSFIFCLSLIIIFFILKTRRTAATNLAWILLVMAYPFVGIPLYVLFGKRKISAQGSGKPLHLKNQQASKETGIQQILQAAGLPQIQSNVSIELAKNGADAFSKTMNLIQGAKSSIFVTTFILGNDSVGRALIQALAEKAALGIDVRIIVDSLSTLLLKQPSLAGLKTSGGKVSYFMPLFHGRFNLRNHRKLLIVDGKTSILGGMNLTEQYMGPKQNEKMWADICVRIEGGCVSDLQQIFLQDWAFASGEKQSQASVLPDQVPQSSKLLAQVVASGPDVQGDPLYDVLICALHLATHEIQIVTPYFIPDEVMEKALELAAKRGVRVQILIPKKSNHFLADLARGSYVRPLAIAGVEFQFFDKMVHAKAVLIDNSVCFLGSANFDMRSLLLNFELSLLIYDETFLTEFRDWISDGLGPSTRAHQKETFLSPTFEGLGRIIGPFI